MVPDAVPLYDFVNVLAQRQQQGGLSPRRHSEIQDLLYQLGVLIKQSEQYAVFTLRQVLKKRALEQSRQHSWPDIAQTMAILDNEQFMLTLVHDTQWRTTLLQSSNLVAAVWELWTLIGQGAG